MKVTLSLVLYVYKFIIAWGDSGKSRHATPHAHQHEPRWLAHALRLRSASPQDACTCTRQHTTPQTASPTHEHKLQQPNNNTGRAGGHSKNRDAEQGIRPHSAGPSTRNRPPILCLLPKGKPIGLQSSDPETPPHPIRVLSHPIQSEASRCWNTLERRNPSSSNTGSGQ